MNEVKVFEYCGQPISFRNGESKYVNATEMAKPFGKKANEWLSNKTTKEFVSVYSAEVGIPDSQLVVVKYGDNGGTWMHEDVAMEFARWLSPKFAIWCNDRIKELMKYGITATQQTIEGILADPSNAIKVLEALQEERKRNAALKQQNAQVMQLVEEQKPAVNFAKAVENSDSLILIRDMAKILKQHGYDTGEQRLYETLRRDGYLNQDNAPSQRSMELAIMRVTEHTITGTNGTFLKKTTKVTGKGQVYFLNRYARKPKEDGQTIFDF